MIALVAGVRIESFAGSPKPGLVSPDGVVRPVNSQATWSSAAVSSSAKA